GTAQEGTAQEGTAREGGGSNLALAPEDVRIEQSLDGGYVLIIRNKAGIGSVLVTESTEDPDREVASYALRNPEHHPMNGDERRILEGEFIDPDNELYFLVDSTPEPDEEFGSAYRVFVPYIVIYGYSWTRNGEIMVLDGTYLSIRTFEKEHADYSGAFQDNPFVLKVDQRPVAGPPEGNFMDDTVDDFEEIASEGDGDVAYAATNEDLSREIDRILTSSPGRTVDLVLALDTTHSMEDDVPALQEDLVPLLRKKLGTVESLRVGLVYYRDYMEEYLTRTVEFHDNLDFVQRALDEIRVAGGRDIPEAVHEALYAGIKGFPWEAEDKLVILVGDAPAHPRPRGSITKEMVYDEARELGIRLNTIILPQ
ncbi:MAG: hypothetical protein ACOCYG_02365, partial [Spirochaetota bacterium]